MTGRDVTGIILAGGMSRRMGQNKSLMLFRNKPLISYAIETLMPVCREVVISANKPVYDFTRCAVWPDVVEVQAPIAGIYSCLKRSETEWNLFLTCDMPLVDTRLFELMLSNRSAADLVIPIHDGNCVEPLCGVYSNRVIPLLESHIRDHDYSLKHVIREARTRFMEIGPELDFYRTNLFTNINTAEDFGLLDHPDRVPPP